jgi:hypothetical protein
MYAPPYDSFPAMGCKPLTGISKCLKENYRTGGVLSITPFGAAGKKQRIFCMPQEYKRTDSPPWRDICPFPFNGFFLLSL